MNIFNKKPTFNFFEKIQNPFFDYNIDNMKLNDIITNLLEENDINLKEDIDAQTLTFERTPSTLQENAANGLEKCKEKAEKIMNNLLKLYLSDSFITKSEYVQAKKNLDAMTLSSLLFG